MTKSELFLLPDVTEGGFVQQSVATQTQMQIQVVLEMSNHSHDPLTHSLSPKGENKHIQTKEDFSSISLVGMYCTVQQFQIYFLGLQLMANGVVRQARKQAK